MAYKSVDFLSDPVERPEHKGLQLLSETQLLFGLEGVSNNGKGPVRDDDRFGVERQPRQYLIDRRNGRALEWLLTRVRGRSTPQSALAATEKNRLSMVPPIHPFPAEGDARIRSAVDITTEIQEKCLERKKNAAHCNLTLVGRKSAPAALRYRECQRVWSPAAFGRASPEPALPAVSRRSSS